jgi:hypothetical protein
MSLVFQNIDPPPPLCPGECVLPLQQRRGVHNRRAERGVNCLEDERPKIVLLKKLSLYGATTLFLSVLHSKGAAVQKHQW